MADGNIGSLWMSLGIKETVTNELKKIQKDLRGTDEATKSARKEIKGLVDSLKNAETPDKFVQSIDRINQALAKSEIGAKDLMNTLSKTNIKDWTLFDDKLTLKNINQVRDAITRMMASLSSSSAKSEAGLSQFFKLGEALSFVTTIQSADKNLKNLRDTAKTLDGNALLPDANALVKNLENARKQMLEAFNSGNIKNNPALKEYERVTAELVGFYNKLNTQKNGPSLFDNVASSAKKTTDELKATETQATKTKEAVEKVNEVSAKKPAAMKEAFQEEAFSKAVDKIITKTSDVKQATMQANLALNEMLNAFRGSESRILGVGNAGEKGRAYVDILNQVNAAIEKIRKNESGGDKDAKEFADKANRALEYLKLLQRIELAQSKIEDTKAANPNIDSSKIKEALGLITHFRDQFTALESSQFLTGVDKANVLKMYADTWKMTLEQVKGITDKFEKRNPLSDFDNNFTKLDAKIDAFREKLAKLRDLMSEGTSRGYNTSMLTDRITGLNGVITRMENAMGNQKQLSDGALMKQLFSDMAVEMGKATTATTAYGREKGKAIAIEREFAAAAKLSAKDNEAELKAQSDYIKRYMALVEKKREIAEKAGISPFFKNDQGLRNIKAEIDTLLERLGKVREGITLYQHAIGNGTKESIAFGQQGLREANAEAEKLMSTITTLQNVYDTLRVSQANVKDLIGQTPQKQRQDDIQKRMSEYYSNLEKTSAKEAAQATRDETKAKQEDAQAEKQRQTEIKNTESRYDSLGNKVRQLRAEYSKGVTIGADVSKAESEIHRLISIMRGLLTIREKLKSSDWKDSLGMLGNIGSGHDTTLASRALQDQKAINREAQKGVGIEQKRQAEIAKSAAKARNDLAAAFAGANAEAKKMQSVVSDIKSLFLQGGIVFGAQQFFNSIVQTGGEIVQQHVALRSILGDVQKADELFSQTQQLALQSPFKFGELNRDVKQLAAFGVEANDLYDTTKRLADIASGLGVSFERLGLAYGQVKARSWLDSKELRQFAYAGLPLLQKITDLYNQEGKNGRSNYTQADVKKMISGRQVSFEDVQKVLWNMTNEGGQFYNMQLVLSETLLGRWNKLIDAWDIMLGKFAEGKNVVGGTFSFIINRVTDLVLALDKLSPAILSFGAIFAVRKLGGMAYSKIGLGSLVKNYTQQMNAQLKSYAIEQQQLVVEGKITQQKALQNVQARAYLLADDKSRANAMSRLALEGKLSVSQMQKAVREELVSKELIKQLAIMGQITAKQEQIILGGTRFAAVMNTGISKIGGGIKSLFTMLGGWWGLAIGLAAQVYSSYSSDMDKISENANGFRESAYNKKKGYDEELSNDKPTNNSDLQQRVNSMKEILKNSGDYTQTIEDQIAKAKTLNEQYDILNKGVVAARDNSQQEVNDSDVIAGALGASGGWGAWNPFTDTIEEAVEGLNEAVVKYQTALSGLDGETKERMDSIANQFLKPEERVMSLEDKIRILAERGGANWDSFVIKSSNGSNDIANSIYKIGIRANKVSDKMNDIAQKNVPRIINFLKKSFNLFGADFSKWCNRNASRFESMINKILDACKVNVPQIREYLKSIFYKEAGAKQPKKSDGEKAEKQKTPMQQRIRKNLSKKGKSKTKVESQATMLDSYLDETSDYNTDNNLQTELQNRYNEYKNRENKYKRGKISKALRDEAFNSYNSLREAAWEGLGYKFYPQDKKSNKVPKGKSTHTGRQEDAELKALQERLSSLKSARQMYQKYQTIMSDDAAKEKTLKLFPEVTGLNLNDYQEAVRALLQGFNINTTERKKFQTSVYREVAEWIFDEKDKKAFEEKAATFSEEMNRLASQWDLYKELLQKTGNKYFAKSAWVDAFQMDEKTKSLIDEWYAHYGEVFNLEDSLSLTDGQAKKRFKGADQYNEWKKIVDLLRGNYIKSLQDAADIIEKTEDYLDKIVKIQDKYNKLIEKTNDPGVKARYRQQKNKEIGAVKIDEFKGSSDYLNFYGAITSLGTEKAQAIGAKIRQYINEALQSGAIDAREYSKEIKQLEEQLSKLTQPRKTFLKGGLKGLAEQKFADANEQFTLATSKISDGLKTKTLGEQLGDENLVKRGESMIASGKAMQDAALVLLKDGTKAKETLDKFAGVVGVIDQNVQGMCEAFNDIKETASLLGVDTDSDGWQDASAFFESFSGMSSSISKVVTSAESGNVGGILSGVTGIFTSPIKAFAKAHDNKLDRQIKIAERQLTELKNLSTNIKSSIEATLGGIYSYTRDGKTASKLKEVRDDYNKYQTIADSKFGKRFLGGQNLSHYSKDTYDAVLKTDTNASAYQDQLALLHAQKDELRKQRASEADKKKKDKDKIADYDQQITEMEQQIKTFAQDFLKDIYSIDMKSWASELTDAVVSAWEKGEDAVEAYREKVKDMVKDVTKNIVTQKIMEKALSKPLDYLTSILDEKGKLDETDMDKLADQLYKVGDEVVPQITGVFEALKNRGWDMRENGSSSTSNSVKSITEETADILAAYLQAIRLDVSVNRDEIKRISDAVRSVPELNVIARSQLTAMNQLVTLAEYRNGKLDDMYSWMRSITKETGARSLRIN